MGIKTLAKEMSFTHFGNPLNPSMHWSHLLPLKFFDLQEHCPFSMWQLVPLDPSRLQSQSVKKKQYTV